jgi:hypothetical protein
MISALARRRVLAALRIEISSGCRVREWTQTRRIE